jgi:hypothetical protein
VPTKIYAGTLGFKYLSPFVGEINDGILTLAETEGTLGITAMLIPSTHTFIMNSSHVATDIADTLLTVS